MSEVRGFGSWAGRVGLGRKLALTLGIFALLSGFATLAELRGVWPGTGAPHLDQLFLLLNFILLLPLIAILAGGWCSSGPSGVAALPARASTRASSCCSA